MKDRIRVTVTEQDWQKAKALVNPYNRSECCVISQAVNRTHKGCEASTGIAEMNLSCDGRAATYRLGKNADILRAAFDGAWKAVKPTLPMKINLQRIK